MSLIDKNGNKLIEGHKVTFTIPDGYPNAGKKVIGEIFEFIHKDAHVSHDESDTMYQIWNGDLELVMDRECQECFEKFNHLDAKTVINPGKGKDHSLYEEKVCPHCKSTEFILL